MRQLFSGAVIGQCKSARNFPGVRCKSCVLKFLVKARLNKLGVQKKCLEI